LPDGLSEIFLRKRLDRPDTQLTDLPVGQISRVVRGRPTSGNWSIAFRFLRH
jgi:hypothetical protein